jgi:AcrR family transcriptional regulator
MGIYLDYLIKNVNPSRTAKSGGMSPRPYQAGPRRRAATAATRERIVAAARELLADPQVVAFSIDAVAERANVARMTVYYQFKSKAKLLEAIFDDFAARANMRELRNAFVDSDPARGLSTLVGVFCHLWKTQRQIVRRLNAFAALDPEVHRALRERAGWRREGLAGIVARMRGGRHAAALVDVLYVLTSFETYDALAEHRSAREIPKLLQRTCAAIVASR